MERRNNRISAGRSPAGGGQTGNLQGRLCCSCQSDGKTHSNRHGNAYCYTDSNAYSYTHSHADIYTDSNANRIPCCDCDSSDHSQSDSRTNSDRGTDGRTDIYPEASAENRRQ